EAAQKIRRDRDHGPDQDEKGKRVSDTMTHLITTYLKKNRKRTLFYVVFLAMFYLVLYLYGVRADALGYAVLLSLVTCTALGIVDFWRYQARIKAVGEAFRNMPYELGSLPAPLDMPEEMYQE